MSWVDRTGEKTLTKLAEIENGREVTFPKLADLPQHWAAIPRRKPPGAPGRTREWQTPSLDKRLPLLSRNLDYPRPRRRRAGGGDQTGLQPKLELRTDQLSVAAGVSQILVYLHSVGEDMQVWICRPPAARTQPTPRPAPCALPLRAQPESRDLMRLARPNANM